MPITLERINDLLTEHETWINAIDEAIDMAKVVSADSGDAESRLYSIHALLAGLSRLPRHIAQHERKLMRANTKRAIWNKERARRHRRAAGIPERVITNTPAEAQKYYDAKHADSLEGMTPEQIAEYQDFVAHQEEPTLPALTQPEVTGIHIRTKERTKTPEERMREMLGQREEEPTLSPEELAKLWDQDVPAE